MATTVRIVRPRDFVRATVEGTLDLAACRQQLAAVATAASSLAECDVIIDTRHAGLTLSITDLWYLAVFFAGLPELRGRRVALLPPKEELQRADFFAITAENRGLRIRVFDAFEPAIDWLVEDRTEIAE